jgi:hypothetical protein
MLEIRISNVSAEMEPPRLHAKSCEEGCGPRMPSLVLTGVLTPPQGIFAMCWRFGRQSHFPWHRFAGATASSARHRMIQKIQPSEAASKRSASS